MTLKKYSAYNRKN